MNVDNPTATELQLIQAAQQRTWVSVNGKTHWSSKDFQDALYSHNEFKREMGGWYFSMASMEKLAFDPRTPELQAKILQDMLIQVKQQQKTE